MTTEPTDNATLSQEKLKPLSDMWCLPSDRRSTGNLLATAGISVNTAKLYLGPRPAAQRAYQAALKRKAKREAKG